MLLNHFKCLVDRCTNFRYQRNPFRTLWRGLEIRILDISVTDGHQILEHFLFDLCDVISFCQRLAFDALHFNLIHVEYVICHESYERVRDWKTVLFEHQRIFHVRNLLFEESSHFVWLEEEFAGHDLDKDKDAYEKALISIVLQLPLSFLIKVDQLLLQRKQEISGYVRFNVRDVT